jgi:hypothetical protein
MDYRDATMMLVEDGIVHSSFLLTMAIKFMSQSDVKQMLRDNGLLNIAERTYEEQV